MYTTSNGTDQSLSATSVVVKGKTKNLSKKSMPSAPAAKRRRADTRTSPSAITASPVVVHKEGEVVPVASPPSSSLAISPPDTDLTQLPSEYAAFYCSQLHQQMAALAALTVLSNSSSASTSSFLTTCGSGTSKADDIHKPQPAPPPPPPSAPFYANNCSSNSLTDSSEREANTPSDCDSTTEPDGQSFEAGSLCRKNYKSLTRERRVEANARERTRVHTISAAFDNLRKTIPSYSSGQKLSKLAILRIACRYIESLACLLDLDYSLDQQAPSFGLCVQELADTINSESKIRRS